MLVTLSSGLRTHPQIVDLDGLGFGLGLRQRLRGRNREQRRERANRLDRAGHREVD